MANQLYLPTPVLTSIAVEGSAHGRSAFGFLRESGSAGAINQRLSADARGCTCVQVTEAYTIALTRNLIDAQAYVRNDSYWQRSAQRFSKVSKIWAETILGEKADA